MFPQMVSSLWSEFLFEEEGREQWGRWVTKGGLGAFVVVD